jgi:transcriptional regulator with XRE-family HTH domain
MKDPLKQHIGAQVQAARHRVGLTQEQLAEQIERTVEAVSNIERAKALPTLETLRRLSEAVKVPLRDFFPEQDGRLRKSEHRLRAEYRMREIARDLSDTALEIALTQSEALLRHSKQDLPNRRK